MTGEAGQVRRYRQAQAQLLVVRCRLEHVRSIVAWGLQQCLDLRLGKLALAVERQLPQQAPAPWQCQALAMLRQVLAQRIEQGTTPLGTQLMQASGAGHEQDAEERTALLHNAQSRFADPFMGAQRLLQQRQRDALFFA